MAQLFLLSPADCSGARVRQLLDPAASFPLAVQLRARNGASVGEVFSFISTLYFRAKLAYATAFAVPPAGLGGVHVIVPGMGLVAPETRLTHRRLHAIGRIGVNAADDSYRRPLVRDARAVGRGTTPGDRIILLGSVATDKYLAPLLDALGELLYVPAMFVGRGSMSRGSVLLRAVDTGRELTYSPAVTVGAKKVSRRVQKRA